jgi:hypothetical protein
MDYSNKIANEKAELAAGGEAARKQRIERLEMAIAFHKAARPSTAALARTRDNLVRELEARLQALR